MSSVFSKLRPEIRTAAVQYNEDKKQLHNDDINILSREEYYHKLPYHVFVFLQTVCNQQLKMNLKDFTFFYQMLDR